MRTTLRVMEIALLALAGLYAGDYLSARYRIPGNRQTLGSVQVRTLWAVRMKNGHFEYSLGDTETQTCVRSLFPQLGYTPCWYLTRHATRRIEVSRAGAGVVALNGKDSPPGHGPSAGLRTAGSGRKWEGGPPGPLGTPSSRSLMQTPAGRRGRRPRTRGSALQHE